MTARPNPLVLRALTGVIALTCASCSSPVDYPEGVEAMSLSGAPLRPPALSDEVRAERERQLTAAHDAYVADPASADALIWYGRRLAYLGRYRDAIEVFSRGAEEHPDDARMLRHRGHRYITVRDFAAATLDLSRAHQLAAPHPDQVEPDGLPNARGIPIGTLKSNIDYHLALAHYLTGDFDAAERVYRRRLNDADSPDRLCSTTYWLVLTLLRLGRSEDAITLLQPIRADFDIIENHAYHRLLLLYKRTLARDDFVKTDDGVQNATLAYGLANDLLSRGETAAGMKALESLLRTDEWAAFGYIAAEADVADPKRLRRMADLR